MLTTLKNPSAASPSSTLEKLFAEHGRFVFRVAYKLTGNKAEAEDILQGLFLRLLRGEHVVDLERNPKGYLYRATVNMALDLIQRNRFEPGGDQAAEHAAAGPGPEREYRSTEIQAWFRLALSKLSPKAAEMFILKHLEGYENDEIAAMVGTTRGTVAVTLFRSRAILKKSLSRFLGIYSGAAHETKPE